MKKTTLALMVVAAGLVLVDQAQSAEITIFDGQVSGSQSGSSWFNQGTSPGEDHEVEPADTGAQVWDMEGLHLNGTVLTMVSGYNVLTGQSDGTKVWRPGDIFFDVNGTPTYGVDVNGTTGNNTTLIPNSQGYDYALRLNSSTLTYQLWALDSSAMVYDSYFAQNQESDPWTYASGGQLVSPSAIPFTYTYSTYNDTVSDPYGYGGGLHHVVNIDLAAFLDANASQDFYIHYTMECGNDHLMGHGGWPVPTIPNIPVSDAASAMTLLGLGLAGIGALSRRLR
ncbi:MAG: hypothetical protein K8T26_04590 [Lentisphaerae bacterium]|nr:hypothetical protein [Lentisphaerota bacterium]